MLRHFFFNLCLLQGRCDTGTPAYHSPSQIPNYCNALPLKLKLQNGRQNLERGLLRHDKEEYSDDTHDVLVVVRIKKFDRGWSKDSIGFD